MLGIQLLYRLPKGYASIHQPHRNETRADRFNAAAGASKAASINKRRLAISIKRSCGAPASAAAMARIDRGRCIVAVAAAQFFRIRSCLTRVNETRGSSSSDAAAHVLATRLRAGNSASSIVLEISSPAM